MRTIRVRSLLGRSAWPLLGNSERFDSRNSPEAVHANRAMPTRVPKTTISLSLSLSPARDACPGRLVALLESRPDHLLAR